MLQARPDEHLVQFVRHTLSISTASAAQLVLRLMRSDQDQLADLRERAAAWEPEPAAPKGLAEKVAEDADLTELEAETE